MFVEFDNALSEYVTDQIVPIDSSFANPKLKSIVFTKDDKFLFASDPLNNQIFVFDKFGSLHDIFVDTDNLEYPTDIVLTSDDKYLLVSNYGVNTVSRLSISDGFPDLKDVVFVNPGDDGITEITQIGLDSVNNLYVVGKTKTEILKYGYDGNFL